MNTLNAYFRQKYLVGRSPEATADLLEAVYKSKGYQFFRDGDFNLNIMGIRNSNPVVDTWEDIMVVSFKSGGQWEIVTFDMTTYPGKFYMNAPINEKGTGYLVPDQYRGAWSTGIHNGHYLALIQMKPVRVYRDNNKDDVIDLDAKTIEQGLFGINIHKAWDGGASEGVGQSSAACQVIRDAKDFENFMAMVDLSKNAWGDSFTYTLFLSSDFA